jgi:hypothetical protein
MKLYNCNCDYQETGTGSAKGYMLISECAECAAKREAENTAILAKEAEEKAVVDAKLAARESSKAKLLAIGTFSQEEIDSILG